MKHKKTLGLLPSFLLILLLAGSATLLVLWMHPVSILAMLRSMLRQPLILLLNYLPLFLLISAFSFLFRNVFFSASFVTFFASLLSIVNRVKCQLRDEPLVPKDFGLLKEAADAMSSYAIELPWFLLAVVTVFCILLLLLGVLFPSRPFPVRPLLLRALGFGGSLGALLLSVLFLYSSTPLYNSFQVTNPYYITGVFNDLGFPYCFCYHFSTYQVSKPAGFDKARAASYETGEKSGEAPDVHVILVMNEAFSDLTNEKMFTYSAQDDPLRRFNALTQEENAVSGHIVVPGFAGGTANTEFDVLTGMQTNALSASSISAFRAFNRNLDSLFRVFDADGYRTSFLHPGDAWFYNRENVYGYLGAQESLFAPEFTNSVSKGRWVTDETVAENILEQFDAAVAADEFLFTEAVTIQNHMSYTADKYGEGYVFPPTQTTASLSPEAETLLSVYIEGVRDADAMLGTLVDSFRASGEPVLLCFYGDHLPYLGDNRLAYRELGSPIADEASSANVFCSYETPFVLWCNEAAAKTLDLSTLDLPQNGRISASFLGATILEASGRRDSSPWFSFLNELRRSVPVMQNGIFETADGKATTELSPEHSALWDKFLNWSYYKLKYKKVSG